LRRADSAPGRQRVIAAINRAVTDGTEITVSAIARVAAVDRTFLYRHRDLLGKIHAALAGPPADSATGPSVTRASLQADLLAAHERAIRLNVRVQQLEKRLSEVLGEQTWREYGLGARLTLTSSTPASSVSNSRPPTCASSLKNATTNSAPPAPPAANSWLTSIRRIPLTRLPSPADEPWDRQ
jgi:hypothetical protein